LKALYPFQKDGETFIRDREATLLGDDMGLGKTVQALYASFFSPKETRIPRILIVCLATATGQWQGEIWDWLGVDSTILTSAQLSKQLLQLKEDRGAGVRIYIINWDALDKAVKLGLDKIKFEWIIADEAHFAKNRKAKRTKALKKLKTVRKIAATGTPFDGRPDELWSILHWFDSKKYRSYWRFYEEYVSYIKIPPGYRKVLGPRNQEKLKEELAIYMIRRTKKEVLKELPDKYYTTVEVELRPEQQLQYEQMKVAMLAWLSEQKDELLIAPTVLAQLTRLRQFAAATAYLNEEGKVQLKEPSAKLDALMDILLGASEPIVVFTQFVGLIGLASERLWNAGILHEIISGDTPITEREGTRLLFQEGKIPVLLVSLKAGGSSLNLQRSSTCIFLDKSWSPTTNVQAEDRLHRIGQKNAVQIISIVAKGTVDEIIEDRLVLKKSWIKSILTEAY